MPLLPQFCSSRLVRSVAPALLLGALGGCTGDETKTLFDEDGVWAVVEFDLDNTGTNAVSGTRANAFMLRFKKKEGIVEAVSCVDETGDDDINSSFCHSDPISAYACRCFAYEFEDNIMRWAEYDPGSAPPMVPEMIFNDTDGADPSLTQILVSEFEGVSAKKVFTPMPDLLWGGTDESVFVLQQKSPSIFENPPDKPPEAPPMCGC